jgi:hypothetical protein
MLAPRICTAETPAPASTSAAPNAWNWAYQHPDATEHEIRSSDYDDVRYRCPHCGQTYVSEGPDA